MNTLRSAHQLSARKIVLWGITCMTGAALARIDVLVATMFFASVVAISAAIRWRRPGHLRRIVVPGAVGVVISGAVTGLALPTLAGSRPLLVNVAAAQTASSNTLVGRRPEFEVVGYVASDYEDSASGVDRDMKLVTTFAPTGATLGATPGSIEVSDATDTLVRSHAAGTRALLVISNFDGTQFNAKRVDELVNSPSASGEFISTLSSVVARQGWDGVVLDFESLDAKSRREYPNFIRKLDEALGSRTIDVAVPAFTDVTDPDLASYDLTAITKEADRITWMAYDQHELSTAAGPVAGLPWMNRSVDLALKFIPPSKLLLGVAAYGYAWTKPGDATEYTVPQAKVLAAAKGATSRWDTTQAEWKATLADGRAMWWSDGRSIAVRETVAQNRHLGGVALWRIGSEEAGALAHQPVGNIRVTPSSTARTGQRSITDVRAQGVVALTFDDGPDPKWTPKILNILRREHVPATFFVVGQEAQNHPSIIREEVRDGNVVGNHTYSHKNLANVGKLRAYSEILGGEAVIEGITGRRPMLFRSPYGAGDSSGKKTGGDQLAARLGEHPVAWNVDPQDWSKPTPREIVRNVTRTIQERSVVLLHDGGGDRSRTIAALPAIIEQLKAQHYLFTTVDGIDGSIPSAYAPRHGFGAFARSLIVVAGFRVWVAGRKAFVLVLSIIALLSILRLILTAPLALIHGRRRRVLATRASEALIVTIAVPAHNEEPVIAKTIDSLRKLVHPKGPDHLEILVIDDGSTDATAEIARKAAVDSPISIRIISQPASKKAGALNRAFAEAKGDVVVVIDADTVVDQHLVEALLPHFADERVGAVAGNVKVGNQRNLLGRLQALEYLVALNLDRRAQATANVMAVVPGAAGAFRRHAVLEAGGYSTDTLVEDADLTVALLLDGWKIPYEPAAVAFTEAPETLNDVVRQRRRWSYGTVEVIAKHRSDVLTHRAGRVGLLGLPWMLLSQVILPLTGPLTDLFLLYLLLVRNWNEAAGILAVAAIADMLLCAAVIILNRERMRTLLLVPLLRLVWRPIQLLAVTLSTTRWLKGRSDGWRKVKRYNSVDAATINVAAPQ